MLLYRTIVGSRLYGTNRPDSDYDWMEVYSSMRAKPRQKVAGENDTIKISLGQFMHYAGTGRHQYLEAIFAPKTDIDMFYDMRRNFYPDTAQTVNLYRRTINSFGNRKARKKDKAMITALRLTYNLEDMLKTGRFNPVLDDNLVSMLKSLDWNDAYQATSDRMNYLAERYGL